MNLEKNKYKKNKNKNKLNKIKLKYRTLFYKIKKKLIQKSLFFFTWHNKDFQPGK